LISPPPPRWALRLQSNDREAQQSLVNSIVEWRLVPQADKSQARRYDKAN
jgi:hypothetical protein